ncbi:hypothetical protein FOXG_11650 [Fusarium oxysporum f. sp. lycopersici 4287]|uniref:Uncharacterized protein n=1 Tax=Fusarium oxysporum f. sp. lycopersici (strain 4287 / CBS 123668 / FGSC 9935 / NRRL 34936) TaxID=426428 RepID=A0A0J9WR56_FUSO4|nr:hypothetical protein FOXG_11650 [Fusarium oxysporum f. sp. lycopersici 4287]KNB11947.1 hypothetical protein FOXG_11650 [Fusarium oxysporum f. sp. lycopersici 4287]
MLLLAEKASFAPPRFVSLAFIGIVRNQTSRSHGSRRYEASGKVYTGDICHILSRSQGPLLIPRTILKKCPKLAARLDKKHIFSKPLDTVDIEDYPFSVGHIIIHYLITDKYQCLKPEGQTEDDRSCSELATAFRAHAATVDLELTSLQLLASSELGVPENVAMVLVNCFLQSKGIGFTQNHDNETGLGDEKALDTSQLAQEERELLTILQTFYKESSQIYQSTFETGVRQKMARETLARTILETWEAGGGSLSSLQHARLQELQNVSVKLSEDLHTCKTDLAASKKALSRSNDLSAAVSVHPLVDPNAKGHKLISQDQEEEDQPDDGE